MLYTVILGAILIVFSAVLYTILSYYLFQNIDHQLKETSQELLSTIGAYDQVTHNHEGGVEFAVERTLFYNTDNYPISIFDLLKVRSLDERWEERADVLGVNEIYVWFSFSDPVFTLKGKNFPSKLTSAFVDLAKNASSGGKIVFHNVHFKKKLIRVITVPILRFGKQIGVLEVGISLSSTGQALNSLIQAMFVGIPLILLLTCFVGFIFVKRILDPIEEIAKTANKITHEDLSLRVKSAHLDAEIKYVVDAFNDMITRLEKSFAHINEFSSQVAHELKTPLAIIRGEAELALSQERDKQSYKETIQINLEETNRMRKTIEDLLLLARLDYQPEIFHFQPFDFISFFQEIYEQTEILASEKGLTVNAIIPNMKIIINGDQLHLRRMFFNIIDNALKYTPSPGEIKLQVLNKDKKILIVISDTGVGIPEKDQLKIFEKFYHVERNGQSGTGLGLSIVQSILKVHQGRIRVSSKPGHGTTFHIILPISFPPN